MHLQGYAPVVGHRSGPTGKKQQQLVWNYSTDEHTYVHMSAHIQDEKIAAKVSTPNAIQNTVQ